MKFICTYDTQKVSSGFFTVKTEIVKVKGLTKGKTYDGNIVTNISGGGNISVRIEHMVMVWDDNADWQEYPMGHFKPA